MENRTNTYLKDMPYWTGATVGTLLAEEMALEKRILEEQGEVITYNLNDLKESIQ